MRSRSPMRAERQSRRRSNIAEQHSDRDGGSGHRAPTASSTFRAGPTGSSSFCAAASKKMPRSSWSGCFASPTKNRSSAFAIAGVNSTNPLFAGLGEDEEDAAQQYDEPVIIRLGVKESEELSDGFPESAEELFAYHGVILDDIESGFFTQDQMLLLRRFVGTRGGGLLLLGGQESFDSQDFGDTPLGELCPLYAPRSSGAKPRAPIGCR